MDVLQIDWDLVISHSVHLTIAYLLAFPIGWDREQSKRHFGLKSLSFYPC
jgi:putative Mg2+ transporter-C (MgtC) family protein